MATISFLHNYKISGKKAKEILNNLENPENIPEKNKLSIEDYDNRIKINKENENFFKEKLLKNKEK